MAHASGKKQGIVGNEGLEGADDGSFEIIDGTVVLNEVGIGSNKKVQKTKINEIAMITKVKRRILPRSKAADPRLMASYAKHIKVNKTAIRRVTNNGKDTVLQEMVNRQNLRYRQNRVVQQKKFTKIWKRGFQWNEKSMIFQIMLLFLVMFSIYFGSVSLFMYLTTKRFIRVTDGFVKSSITKEAT